MNEQAENSIAKVMANPEAITDAITRAVREAVLKHAQAGQPVATWRDGKVVWIPAEEMLKRLSESAK